jgi:pyruvate kinase
MAVRSLLAENRQIQRAIELIHLGEQILLQEGHVRRGEEVVVLAGNTPMKGATNTMKVYTVGRL